MDPDLDPDPALAGDPPVDDWQAELEAARAEHPVDEVEPSIEALAAQGALDDEEDDTVYIEGTTGQLSLSIGGRVPDTAEFRMRSAAVRVEGEFKKGETVELRVIARVDEIDLVDMHDEYGTVKMTKRIHKAKPISVERLNPDAIG